MALVQWWSPLITATDGRVSLLVALGLLDIQGARPAQLTVTYTRKCLTAVTRAWNEIDCNDLKHI